MRDRRKGKGLFGTRTGLLLALCSAAALTGCGAPDGAGNSTFETASADGAESAAELEAAAAFEDGTPEAAGILRTANSASLRELLVDARLEGLGVRGSYAAQGIVSARRVRPFRTLGELKRVRWVDRRVLSRLYKYAKAKGWVVAPVPAVACTLPFIKVKEQDGVYQVVRLGKRELDASGRLTRYEHYTFEPGAEPSFAKDPAFREKLEAWARDFQNAPTDTQLFALDAAGRPTKVTERMVFDEGPETWVTNLTYDGQGRLTEERFEGELSYRFAYDARGRRVGEAMIAGEREVRAELEHDLQGQLVRKRYYTRVGATSRAAADFRIERSYGPRGELARVTWTEQTHGRIGATIDYVYDGRLWKVREVRKVRLELDQASGTIFNLWEEEGVTIASMRQSVTSTHHFLYDASGAFRERAIVREEEGSLKGTTPVGPYEQSGKTTYFAGYDARGLPTAQLEVPRTPPTPMDGPELNVPFTFIHPSPVGSCAAAPQVSAWPNPLRGHGTETVDEWGKADPGFQAFAMQPVASF
ncbi:MAG: RHS repeat protein [Deltaproteobacteria bacterium]|nr:RHS repeat protein [Deltaproteobacteria bacterium]